MDNEDEKIIPGTEVDVCLKPLLGKLKRNTITLFEVIKKAPLRILIDSGSTHSYINDQLVHSLGLRQKTTKPLVVTLADGRKASSKSRCPRADWEI